MGLCSFVGPNRRRSEQLTDEGGWEQGGWGGGGMLYCKCCGVVVIPIPFLLYPPLYPTSLSFSCLFPTLCEITVAIATQHIGVEITVVVGAIATHLCLCSCFSVFLMLSEMQTRTHKRRTPPRVVRQPFSIKIKAATASSHFVNG